MSSESLSSELWDSFSVKLYAFSVAMLFYKVVVVFTSFADKSKSVDGDMLNDSDSGDGVYVG